jgi:HEPN domain-containing protein
MAEQTNTPEDWRLLAEDDLAVANHLAQTMSPIPTAIIAFHCQQAAEKYLKGVLAILGEDPPYIHDLDRLCSIALNHRPSFNNISSSCTIINYFSVQPRYDRGISLSDEDMRTVLTHTRKIKEFLQNEISDLFTKSDQEKKEETT